MSLKHRLSVYDSPCKCSRLMDSCDSFSQVRFDDCLCSFLSTGAKKNVWFKYKKWVVLLTYCVSHVSHDASVRVRSAFSNAWYLSCLQAVRLHRNVTEIKQISEELRLFRVLNAPLNVSHSHSDPFMMFFLLNVLKHIDML